MSEVMDYLIAEIKSLRARVGALERLEPVTSSSEASAYKLYRPDFDPAVQVDADTGETEVFYDLLVDGFAEFASESGVFVDYDLSANDITARNDLTVSADADIGGLVKGRAFHLNEMSINDDAAYSWSPSSTSGVLLVYPRDSTSAAEFGLVGFRCTATVFTQSIVVGANVNVTTGALAGTTGTDGKMTISAHSDAKIYIENRRGGTRSMGMVIFGA